MIVSFGIVVHYATRCEQNIQHRAQHYGMVTFTVQHYGTVTTTMGW